MREILITIAVLTSIGAYLVGSRWLGLSRRGLRKAASRVLETIGLAIVFLAVNLAATLALVGAVRLMTGIFVSPYVTDDVTWLGLALLQGLTMQWWRFLR